MYDSQTKLQEFQRLMSEELENNVDKGNWMTTSENTSIEDLMSKLQSNSDKLISSLCDMTSSTDIQEKLADTANVLLFIANKYNLLDQ